MGEEETGPCGEPEPLPAAVAKAIQFNRASLEAAGKRGMWRSPSFGFVSRLREHPELRDLGPFDVAERLKEILERHAPPGAPDPWIVIGEADSRGNPVGDLEASFLETWGAWRPSPLAAAVRRALERPLALPGIPPNAPPGFATFANVCAYLARESEGGRFYVSVSAFGSALTVHPRTVNNWRLALVRLGLMRQVEKASKIDRAAAAFEWLAPLPPPDPKGPPCRYCGGSGICPTCKGEPWHAHAHACASPCPYCGGTGRCGGCMKGSRR